MTVTTKIMARAGTGRWTSDLDNGICENRSVSELRPGSSHDSGNAHFGQFDRHSQVDFGQNLVEPIVSGTIVEVSGRRLKP
jgi:hypothetical protein